MRKKFYELYRSESRSLENGKGQPDWCVLYCLEDNMTEKAAGKAKKGKVRKKGKPEERKKVKKKKGRGKKK